MPIKHKESKMMKRIEKLPESIIWSFGCSYLTEARGRILENNEK